MMALLILLQLFGTKFLEKKVEQSSLEHIQHYSQNTQSVQLKLYEQSLDFYIETIAQILTYDLYNVDTEAILQKAQKFMLHEGLCTLSVLDTVSLTEVARIDKSINNTCKTKTIELSYKDNKIGILNLSYTLEPIHEQMRANQALITENTSELKKTLKTTTLSSIGVQIFLSLFVMAFLLMFVATQINKNVITPIYKMLEEMKQFREEKILTIDHAYYKEEDEIGKLMHYFHKHIATLINRLNKRANYDGLTQLLSRQRLLYDLDSQQQFLLAIVDIDRFKEINNYLGISSGDHVLKSTAELLSRFFDPLDYRVYRLSGDEFAILSYKNYAANALAFKQTITHFLDDFENQELSFGDEHLVLSMSAGMADSSANEPMVAAMTALGYAKKTKQKLVVFSKNLPVIEEYGTNLKITKIIKHAITDNLVFPHFQPIQCLRQEKVVKYEALMRIQDEEGKLYYPLDFLAISKHTGTYDTLSKTIIQKALEAFCDTEFDVTINLSTRDIESEYIYAFLEELQTRYNVMHRVVFEITEQEGISNFETVREFAQNVKKMGAKIAIDDFGSGYSNFENIIHLEVDFLKIDGSLIKNILTDKNAQIVVETIVSFAKKLGIETIAEFISSEAIYTKVKAMGIDYAQGYYIGKPGAFPSKRHP
ncbi:MAG: EAL domain-containing protein [Campylobacterales bacterium]|nr:EAL domain-containing protein [Campylobacterales bacterium]